MSSISLFVFFLPNIFSSICKAVQNKNTKYNGNNDSENKSLNQNNNEKKRFKLQKNIDTFKDENEPDIKTKLGNIKNSITEFFGKFKSSGLDDKIDNPVYRYNPNENRETNS